MNTLPQLFVNGVVAGSIFALAGIGVSLTFGILNVVNFAQGEYLTYGAYVAVLVNIVWSRNMVEAVIGAVATVALLAVLLEFSFWRPMRRKGAGHFTMLLASFGLALVTRGILFIAFGANPRTYKIDVFAVYEIGGIRLSESELIAVILGLFSIASVALLFSRTHIGKTMRALADNHELAAVSGVNTDRLILFTWILTGALAGLAGVLQGLLQNAFDPNMGGALLLPVFAAVVLGGFGSVYGALAGGLLVGLAMELSAWSGFAGGVTSVWQPVVAFVVLVLVLLVRPQGLLGQAPVR